LTVLLCIGASRTPFVKVGREPIWLLANSTLVDVFVVAVTGTVAVPIGE